MSAGQLPSLSLRDLSGGMVSFASDALLPANVSRQTINLNFDILGKASQRYGTTQLGSTVESGKTCTGLYQFINAAGTINSLLVGFNTSVYAYNGTTYTRVRSGLDGTPVRFTALLDNVFMVGGGGSTMTSAGNSAFSAGSLVTSAPSGNFIESFKQRIYIAGNTTNPDRLFFSTIASTAGSITWNTSTQYLDVNPQDGNNITALKKISNLLLIFKKYTMYRWNGSATDAENVVDIGTTSQESVVQAKGLVYFFSSSPLGIFMTDGSYPQEISRPVHDWLLNMSSSFYGSTVSLADDDHAYFHIGDVTKDGRSYSNVYLVFTISSKNWTVYSMADSFRRMGRYVTTSGNVTFVGGDTSGRVQTLFSGTTDNTTPIYWEYETKQFDFDSRATMKSMSSAALFLTNGAGCFLAVKGDAFPYQTVGEATGPINYFKGFDVQGNFMSLKAFGTNRNTPITLEGFEVVDVRSLGYQSKN